MRNKFLKRTMALAMTLCMALSMATVASAEETATGSKLNLDLNVTRVEDTLTAEVAITENTANFQDLQIKLNFNKDQLEFKSVKAGAAALELTAGTNPNEKGALNAIASSKTAYNGTGVVYTATFAVKAGAPEDVTVAFGQDWCKTDTNSTLTFTTNSTPVDPQPGQGVAISGTITSYLDDSEVIVELLKGESVAYSAKVTGQSAQYAIENVAAGTYTMKVSKLNHVTRTYEVVVADAAVKQDATINPLGDVTGDGDVTLMDMTTIYDHAKEVKMLEGYVLACGDVTKDGDVTLTDMTAVYDHAKEITPIW